MYVFCAKGYLIAKVFPSQKGLIIQHHLILAQQKKKNVHLTGIGKEGEGQTETCISNAANFLREKHRLLKDTSKVIALYYGMRSC